MYLSAFCRYSYLIFQTAPMRVGTIVIHVEQMKKVRIRGSVACPRSQNEYVALRLGFRPSLTQKLTPLFCC